MPVNAEYRIYKMTDGELCSFTSNLCNILTRDLTALSVFGMTAPKIAALKALGDAFEIFTTDEVYLANIMAATEAKNEIIANLREEIRNMVLRCQMKWGSNSHQERALAVSALTKLNDDSLLVTARRVHEQMTLFLADLTDLGLTQDLLDSFEDLYHSFEDAMNEQKNRVNERDIKTKERIRKGNELYQVVSDYCDIGKRVFEMNDPARYDDYIIYTSTSPGTLAAPQNVTFNSETLTLSWHSVDNATSYQVRYSTDNVTFEEIFNDSGLSVYFEPLTAGMIYFSVRARNSGGYGPSTILELDYTPVLQPSSGISLTVTNATTHTIALNWSPVNFATGYRLYRSTVALGADEGAYSLVGEYSGTTYSGAQTAGMRHYFHVVSVNATQTSVPSLPVFVDL